MKSRAARGCQRDATRTPVEDVPVRQYSWRRWGLLGLAAVAAAGAVAGALAVVLHDDERTNLRSVIAESASKATPAAAPLLREAGEVADQLLTRFPENGEVLDVTASLYQGIGKTKDAVRCWQRSIELSPALGPIAHAAMGAAAYDEGNLEAAVTHYRAAMQADPASAVYPVHLGQALIDQGKLPEAVESLEKSLRAQPTSMPISALLGQAYLKLRRYDKARQHFEYTVALEPDYTNAFFGLATACVRLGDQEKSEEYMSRFKELQAREEQLHRTALKESTKTGQTRDLVAQTYRNASKIYLALGDFQTSERHLRRAAEICPQDAEGDSLLAWLYEQQGRTAEAVQALDRLCKKGPNDFNTQMTAASAYARLKQFDEAERAFRRAIELTPLRAGGYAALAHFFLQAQRNLDEAGRLAEKAVQLEPAAEHHFLLSLVRRTRGDTAGAGAAIEAAIALAPQNSGYQQIRRELDRAMQAAETGAGLR